MNRSIFIIRLCDPTGGYQAGLETADGRNLPLDLGGFPTPGVACQLAFDGLADNGRLPILNWIGAGSNVRPSVVGSRPFARSEVRAERRCYCLCGRSILSN